MSYSTISWPRACVGCGTTENELRMYTDTWSSTDSRQSGRKVRHTTVSVGISVHLCPICLDEADYQHRAGVRKYKIAIKWTPILALAIAFFWMMLAFVLAVQATYPLVYGILTYIAIMTSITGYWSWLALGGLVYSIIPNLYLNGYKSRLDEPYNHYMNLLQQGSNILFQFSDATYYNLFSIQNPGTQVRNSEGRFLPNVIGRFSNILCVLAIVAILPLIIFPTIGVPMIFGLLGGFVILGGVMYLTLLRLPMANFGVVSKATGGMNYE